jgi:hypothetical protein
MSEVQGFLFDSNSTATVLVIVAAALSFVIALLVFLCDQPVLDPNFEGQARFDRRGKNPRQFVHWN